MPQLGLLHMTDWDGSHGRSRRRTRAICQRSTGTGWTTSACLKVQFLRVIGLHTLEAGRVHSRLFPTVQGMLEEHSRKQGMQLAGAGHLKS